jgi:hypothetical protein
MGDIKVQSAGRDIIMANFRRRKGDPVEFTRFYRAVKEAVSEMICPVENQYS